MGTIMEPSFKKLETSLVLIWDMQMVLLLELMVRFTSGDAVITVFMVFLQVLEMLRRFHRNGPQVVLCSWIIASNAGDIIIMVK